MWPARQLRTESRTLIAFQEPAHVAPAQTQWPSTKKQVTPTMSTCSCEQMHYRHFTGKAGHKGPISQPTTILQSLRTPKFTWDYRRKYHTSFTKWLILPADRSDVYFSFWLLDSTGLDMWFLEFCFPSAQVASSVHSGQLLEMQTMKIFPLGYVCKSSALLIHQKVYAAFQSQIDII